MSISIDLKFIELVGRYLLKFKKRSQYLWNCRCPYCGDSAKDSLKARGYILKRADSFYFYCHNCSTSKKFSTLLKKVAPELYYEYLLERAKGEKIIIGNFSPKFKQKRNKEASKEKLNLPTLKEMKPDSFVEHYVYSRRIPEKFFGEIYYSSEFNKWIKQWCKENKITEPNYLSPGDMRLVFPIYDLQQKIVGIVARTFTPNVKMRYIKLRKPGDFPLIYGLDNWNKFEYTYVVEGTFDSLFLPNSLAVLNGNLAQSIDRLSEQVSLNKEKTVLIFDNERRNGEIVKNMEKAIDKGYSVFLWPNTIKSKDINDYVRQGGDIKKLLRIIDDNTTSGLESKIHFSNWKKVIDEKSRR